MNDQALGTIALLLGLVLLVIWFCVMFTDTGWTKVFREGEGLIANRFHSLSIPAGALLLTSLFFAELGQTLGFEALSDVSSRVMLGAVLVLVIDLLPLPFPSWMTPQGLEERRLASLEHSLPPSESKHTPVKSLVFSRDHDSAPTAPQKSELTLSWAERDALVEITSGHRLGDRGAYLCLSRRGVLVRGDVSPEYQLIAEGLRTARRRVDIARVSPTDVASVAVYVGPTRSTLMTPHGPKNVLTSIDTPDVLPLVLSVANLSNTPMFDRGPREFPGEVAVNVDTQQPKELIKDFIVEAQAYEADVGPTPLTTAWRNATWHIVTVSTSKRLPDGTWRDDVGFRLLATPECLDDWKPGLAHLSITSEDANGVPIEFSPVTIRPMTVENAELLIREWTDPGRQIAPVGCQIRHLLGRHHRVGPQPSVLNQVNIGCVHGAHPMGCLRAITSKCLLPGDQAPK